MAHNHKVAGSIPAAASLSLDMKVNPKRGRCSCAGTSKTGYRKRNIWFLCTLVFGALLLVVRAIQFALTIALQRTWRLVLPVAATVGKFLPMASLHRAQHRLLIMRGQQALLIPA